jgi:hypothetical protein
VGPRPRTVDAAGGIEKGAADADGGASGAPHRARRRPMPAYPLIAVAGAFVYFALVRILRSTPEA